ncbi:MAG: hypothetical protein JWQ79_1491 [Mucilaginibacter sp.]|nr:hypothetical protein [Mucilaginibacter sp.]
MEIITSIDRVDDISYKDFVENYVNKRIPVVFNNASNWEESKKFTPEFFNEHFKGRETVLGGTTYSMEQLLDLTAKSTKEKPAPYPTHFEVPEKLPELLDMLEPMHFNYQKPDWFRSKLFPYGKLGNHIHLFIGGQGNQYVLHRDVFHTNAWVTQLYGEKKFVIFHGADQDEYLYAKDGEFYSPINILTPDYEKHPKYKNARPLEIILQPGDTLYIPNGVWHTTVAYGQNISLIGNQMNGANYPAWKNDIYEFTKRNRNSKLKASINYAWALYVGTVCKLAELTGRKF